MAEKSTQLILTVHRDYGLQANKALAGFGSTPRLTQQRFKAATTEDMQQRPSAADGADTVRHSSVGAMTHARMGLLRAAAAAAKSGIQATPESVPDA